MTLSANRAALYYLFCQASTGPIDLEQFWQLFPRAGRAQQLIELAVNNGYLERDGTSARLTSRGYDRCYDLERWVTHHLTEPLWKALIVEHGANEVNATPISLGVADRMWLRLMGV